MSKEDDFFYACRKAGIHQQGCGLAALDLMQQMQREPVKQRHNEMGRLLTPNISMGACIKRGLARFVAERGHYELTPAGVQWLADLAHHNLLTVEVHA